MERIDELQRGGYRIIQQPGRFCFGTDAVLLADFAKAKRGERVMDLCTGTGIVPLLMLARYPKATYEALEIQPEMADMAQRSMRLNQVEDRICVRQGDLRTLSARALVGREPFPPQGGKEGNAKALAEPSYAAHGFQVVTANPPYMRTDTGAQSMDESVRMARCEVCCSLRDVVEAAAFLLADKGRFYMVHKPQRLAEIFEEMQRVQLEPKRLQFVHPFADKEPAQVLVEGVLRGGRELRVLPPLITYEAPGVYTKQMLEVYGQDGHHSKM